MLVATRDSGGRSGRKGALGVKRLAVPVEWILAALDHAVIATDLEGVVQYWNPAAERLYGWSTGEAVGSSIYQLTVPEAITTAADDVMGTLRAGSKWTGEFVVRRQDGSTFTAHVTDLPVFDDDGLLVGVVGLSYDLAGAEDERHLREALAASRVGTWRLDTATGTAEWDATTEALHGVEAGSFAGTVDAWVATIHPDDRERARRCLGDDVLEYRTVASNDVGKPTWIEARGRGNVGVVVEITDRKRAEAALREEHQIVETLHHIGSALSAELELDSIVQAVTDAGTTLVGAQFGAFFYKVEGGGGESYTLYTLSGIDQSAFTSFPMPRSTKIFAPTFTGAGVVRLDDVTADPRYGQNPPYEGLPEGHPPVRSHLAVPVVSRAGEVHGGLFFAHEDAGVFDERDERVVIGIAGHAAIAIDNARLYEAAQRDRNAAEAAVQRLARLNAMAYRLAAARTIADAANAIVAEAGDALGASAALVCARSEDGRELEVVSASEAAVAIAERWGPISLSAQLPIVDSYTSGALVLMGSVAERDARYPGLAGHDTGSKAFAAIPLEVEGESYGVLALSFPEERTFSDDDASFMVALGLQAGQALGRARLADAERRAARTLQQSLLPPGEIVVPGLEVASRYHAFGDASAVGGDFFDVFAIGDSSYGAVMGDVRGKGIQSAAVTALARYTVRAATQCGRRPSDAIRLVNRAIYEQDDPERFCTVVHLVLRAAEDGSGWFDVELACGGHPLPLLVTAEGSVRSIGTPGTVVGLFENPELHDVHERLAPGDVLVLYTDGVLEARSPDGRFDPGLLEAAVRGAAGGTAEEVASAIERAVLRFEGGRLRDDMAVLVVRVPS